MVRFHEGCWRCRRRDQHYCFSVDESGDIIAGFCIAPLKKPVDLGFGLETYSLCFFHPSKEETGEVTQLLIQESDIVALVSIIHSTMGDPEFWERLYKRLNKPTKQKVRIIKR